MKSKEELEQIKEEYAELNKKLAELTEDELKQVVGGLPDGDKQGGAIYFVSGSSVGSSLMSETGKAWIHDIGVTDPSMSGGQQQ